jgi:hypothetical protein
MQNQIQVNLLYPLPNSPGKMMKFKGVVYRLTSLLVYVKAFVRGQKSTTLVFNRATGRQMNTPPTAVRAIRKRRGRVKKGNPGRAHNVFPHLRFGGVA